MKRFSILGGLAVSLFSLPALAQETAYTTTGVTLESGPAPDYPAVGSFGPGTPVTLYGCLDGYNWCDVSYQDARGWVDGQALAYPYEEQRVPIAVYGPELRLPIVSFTFGDYWDHYYRNRPFFAERERFEHHAPPPPPQRREAPPPLPPRGRAAGAPPPEHPPAPGPHPAPAAARPEPRPEARPPVPQPQPAIHQPEARPPAGPPHPEPAARPAEARPPEAHPPAAPHPEPHPGEEPHEGEAPH
jgi:uncharacterized protein YraI